MKLLLLLCLLLSSGIFFDAHAQIKSQGSNTKAVLVNPEDANLQRLIRLALDEKWVEARDAAAKYNDPTFATAVVTTIKLYQSPKSFTALEIKAFLEKNDWIPLELFANRMERAITFDYPAESVINWFTFREPTTNQGKFNLLHANIVRNTLSLSDNDTKELLRYYWRTTEFDLTSEEYFLKKYKNYLTIEDCLSKIEFLTWRGQLTYAERLINILPKKYTTLSNLRLQLAKKPEMLAKLLHGRSKEERSDNYIQYVYINQLLDNGHEAEAFQRLRSFETKDYNEKWWKLKNIAIRNVLREKQYLSAYNLAIKHGLGNGQEFAEAEWLAGWIALRFLNEYDKSIMHFQVLFDNAKLSNTRSKAAYWLARGYEALGDESNATKWFEISSQYPGTFYGHISMGRLHGSSKIDYFADNATSKESPRFRSEKAWKLAKFSFYLYKNGANKFARQLIETLPDLELAGDEVQDIAKLFLDNGLYYLAVDLSKTMANKSSILVRAGYPSHVPIHGNHLPKGLYLGIIRQESNFNQTAISSAGAQGLMQLMPGTDAKLSRDLGLKGKRNAHDPSQNVLKGVTYVNQLYSQYGNLVLALAAYNAGPGNVNKWLARYGDPRNFSSEYQAVDWIESIPYNETRNYVKKVLENFAIYDCMLSPQHHAKTLLAYIEK